MEQLRFEADNWEYDDAFRSIRAGKNLFLVVLLVAFLVQLAGFVAVNYGGVLDETVAPAPATTAQPPVAPIEAEEVKESAAYWNTGLTWAMRFSKVATLLAALLLSVTLAFAVLISLVGRLGGAAGYTGAFLWSFILVALCIPWRNLFGIDYISGAAYSLDRLVASMVNVRFEQASLVERMFYYVRFVGYPVVTLLVWLIVCLKFSRARRQMATASPSREEEPAKQP